MLLRRHLLPRGFADHGGALFGDHDGRGVGVGRGDGRHERGNDASETLDVTARVRQPRHASAGGQSARSKPANLAVFASRPTGSARSRSGCAAAPVGDRHDDDDLIGPRRVGDRENPCGSGRAPRRSCDLSASVGGSARGERHPVPSGPRQIADGSRVTGRAARKPGPEPLNRGHLARPPNGHRAFRSTTPPPVAELAKTKKNEPPWPGSGSFVARYKQLFDPLEPEADVARPMIEFCSRHILSP
jgi:hypothetical protein